MSKRKRSKKRPQPRHKTRKQSSQHDKRKRLRKPNPKRKRTTCAKFPLTQRVLNFVTPMLNTLDRRIGWRLPIILAGMLFAEGRRTASRWFVAAGVKDDWDRFYDFLICLGKKTQQTAAPLVQQLVAKFAAADNDRILVALDDSPTQRNGPHVEGAGVHHHPTPGPADGKWLYGHVWVTLSWLATHSLWGVISLPLLALLYVRQVNVEQLAALRGWEFKTKHELGVQLVKWFLESLGDMARDVWIVADGAYAARPFLLPLLEQNVVVVSRLRKDAKLWDLPPQRRAGQRGRPRIYGRRRLSLAKRAAHPLGWESITYNQRGVQVTREYKTFLATSRLVSGVIRVVIVRDEQGRWVPYFCTKQKATVQEILEAAASRWAIEETFHDVKEIWGSGQQQVRNVWSNIACWNLSLWMYTLVELCLWDASQEEIQDRDHRSWDNPERRPSHADRRKTLARECLEQELIATLSPAPDKQKFRRLAEALFDLCT